MLVIAVCLVIALDAIPTFFTVFDIVRSQYFYLSEELTTTIPKAVIELVCSFLMIETAEKGSEGMSFALLFSFYSLSQPFGTTVSVLVFGLFQPSLSQVQNYSQDTSAFRVTVASSYLLQYGTAFAALLLLPLIPWQKEEAQRRKKEYGSRRIWAIIGVAAFTLILIYSVVGIVLNLMPIERLAVEEEEA